MIVSYLFITVFLLGSVAAADPVINVTGSVAVCGNEKLSALGIESLVYTTLASQKIIDNSTIKSWFSLDSESKESCRNGSFDLFSDSDCNSAMISASISLYSSPVKITIDRSKPKSLSSFFVQEKTKGGAKACKKVLLEICEGSCTTTLEL